MGGIVTRKRFWLAMAMMGSLTIAPLSSVMAAKVVRTPKKIWIRELADAGERLILRHDQRVVLIDMQILDTPPDDANIQELVTKLTGETGYRLIGHWPKDVLAEADVQIGLSMATSSGRRGVYTAVWRKRGDGKYAVSAYVAFDMKDRADNIADFNLVRSLTNQMRRGAFLRRPDTAPILYASSVAVPELSSVQPEDIAVTASAAPLDIDVKTDTAPAAVAEPVDALGASVAAVVAENLGTRPANVALISRNSYPYMAEQGSGVAPNQVAAIVYAPLESSEVFVLFKDGTFHENLPVALEDWNIGASRKGDPDSWGKWKRGSEDGEYELRYSADDIVTIAGNKVTPASSNQQLAGEYAIEGEDGKTLNEDSIIFAGGKFKLTQKGTESQGSYTVQSYTITLTFDDGRTEHRPFFAIPGDDSGDNASIWFGDELRTKVE